MPGLTSTAAFWDLISAFSTGRERNQSAALTAALSARAEGEIEAFGEELARVLHELDTPAQFQQRADFTDGR